MANVQAGLAAISLCSTGALPSSAPSVKARPHCPLFMGAKINLLFMMQPSGLLYLPTLEPSDTRVLDVCYSEVSGGALLLLPTTLTVSPWMLLSSPCYTLLFLENLSCPSIS